MNGSAIENSVQLSMLPSENKIINHSIYVGRAGHTHMTIFDKPNISLPTCLLELGTLLNLCIADDYVFDLRPHGTFSCDATLK